MRIKEYNIDPPAYTSSRSKSADGQGQGDVFGSLFNTAKFETMRSRSTNAERPVTAIKDRKKTAARESDNDLDTKSVESSDVSINDKRTSEVKPEVANPPSAMTDSDTLTDAASKEEYSDNQTQVSQDQQKTTDQADQHALQQAGNTNSQNQMTQAATTAATAEIVDAIATTEETPSSEAPSQNPVTKSDVQKFNVKPLSDCENVLNTENQDQAQSQKTAAVLTNTATEPIHNQSDAQVVLEMKPQQTTMAIEAKNETGKSEKQNIVAQEIDAEAGRKDTNSQNVEISTVLTSSQKEAVSVDEMIPQKRQFGADANAPKQVDMTSQTHQTVQQLPTIDLNGQGEGNYSQTQQQLNARAKDAARESQMANQATNQNAETVGAEFFAEMIQQSASQKTTETKTLENTIAQATTAVAANKTADLQSPVVTNTPTPEPDNTAAMAADQNIDRVVKAATAAVNRNESKIQLRLDPPELGTLNVEIRHNASGLQLTLQAGTARAQQLLQNNVADLRTSLEAQGLPAVQIDVQLRQDLRDDANLPSREQPNSGYQQQNSGQDGRQFDSFFSQQSQQQNDQGWLDFDEDSPAQPEPESVSPISANADGWQEMQFKQVNMLV